MRDKNIQEKFKEVMESWICPKCGKQVEWKWSMCQNCGVGKPLKNKEKTDPNIDSKK